MPTTITDARALSVLAGRGMTGADARTALATWRRLAPAARATHPDAARVESIFRASGIA